jgi:hypothetical protein
MLEGWFSCLKQGHSPILGARKQGIQAEPSLPAQEPFYVVATPAGCGVYLPGPAFGPAPPAAVYTRIVGTVIIRIPKVASNWSAGLVSRWDEEPGRLANRERAESVTAPRER